MASTRTLFALSTTILASSVCGSTYLLRKQLLSNHEESEARFDELEGTMRAHAGVIEEALERLEGKKKGRLVADDEGTKGNGP